MAQIEFLTSSRDVKSIQLIAGYGSAVGSSSFSDRRLNQGSWDGGEEGDEERRDGEGGRKIPGQIPGDCS